jgi:hypothetical protein
MNNELPPTMDSTPVPSSLWSRLANVIATPGEVFTAVKNSPINHANWWVPALLFIMLNCVSVGLIYSQPAIRQQVADLQERAMQKQFQQHIDSGKMTQAQADQIKAQSGQFAEISAVIGALVAPAIAAAVTPFWGGFVLWVGASLLFKRPFPYLKGVEVVGLAMVVVALGALVRGLLAVATGNAFASVSLILLVKEYDATNPLHNMLMTLDAFALWALVLRAVGLSKLTDISFAKATAWVLTVWFIITGGLFGFGWAMQKLMASLMGQR